MRMVSFSAQPVLHQPAQHPAGLRTVLRFQGTNVPKALPEMPLINIESPFSGENPTEREQNIQYARQCMRDSLKRGEAPWVMHLLYPQVLDDDVPEERSLGISAGLAWRGVVDQSVAYLDRGLTVGMAYGLLAAWESEKPVQARSLYNAPVPTEDELKAIVARKFPKVVAGFPDIQASLQRAAARHPDVSRKFPALAGNNLSLFA